MEEIRIPGIYCPFPSHMSPYTQAAHEHSLAWATGCRFLARWDYRAERRPLARLSCARRTCFLPLKYTIAVFFTI